MFGNLPQGFFTPECCPYPTASANGCPVGNVYVLGVVLAPPVDMVPDEYYLIAATPTAGQAFEGHANEYVKLSGVNYVFCPPTAGDHVTVYGLCTVLCYSNGAFGISNPDFTGGVSSLGPGLPVVIDWTGSTLNSRTIRGTGATTVTLNGDGSLVINSPVYVAGSGEVNDAINVGTGIGTYNMAKTGTALQMRSLLQGTNIVLTLQPGGEILIDATVPSYTPSYGANVAGGSIPIFESTNGAELRFFQLDVDSEWTSIFDVTADADRVTLHYTPSGHSFDIFSDTSDLYSAPAAQSNVMMWDSTLLWVNRPITMVNLGAHPVGSTQLWSSRSGLTFNFRELLPGTGVTMTQDANAITINASGGTYLMANLGAGLGVWDGVVATTFSLKSLKGSTDIFLSATATEITIEGRTAVAGAGMTITPSTTINTFEVTGWSTLLSDAAAGDASLIKSGPPWLLRTLNGGSGIAVVQTTNGVTFDHALLFSSLGGGLDFVDGWVADTLEAPTAVAGAGMDIQRVGDTVVFSVTSGGGSGAGVSGTALVGGFANTTVSTAMDMWGFTATTVKFPTTTLSVATITKNGANEEFTINKVGKWKIAAKATINTGSSQTQHEMWAEVDTSGGGTWVEVGGSRSYAYTTNELHDLQTIHTGEFSLNVTNLTTKVRFRVITGGGTAAVSLMAGGTMATFEEAVGPVWEVIADATTARTLTSTDNGKIIDFTSGSAVTVTCGQDMLASFQCDIIQSGAGLVSMVGSGAATMRSVVGTTPDISAQHGRARIVTLSGTGANAVYNISGNIV